VIGEIMADLADWGRSRHDLQLFNLARFTGQVSELYRDHPGRIRTGGQDLRSHRRALPRRRARTRTQTTRRIRETRVRSPRSRPPSRRRNTRDQRTNRVGGQILKRTRTRQLQPAGPMSGSPLGTVQHRGREFIDQDYRWDTTDPRFWEKDDVQTFW
jgi:hypothetical protein